jgi:hypothetical protein
MKKKPPKKKKGKAERLKINLPFEEAMKVLITGKPQPKTGQ